jgi:Trk-type K+ transport system membrane component
MTFEEALRIRDRDVRWEYVRVNWIQICIAVAALLGSITFVIMPDVLGESSVGHVLSTGLRCLWLIVYFVGSSGIVGAVWFRPTRPARAVGLEAVACVFLAACYIVYSIAIFENRGGPAGAAAASVFAGLAIGMTGRGWLLTTDRVSPWRRRS